MICSEARKAILEADIPFLEGIGEDPLPEHLRICPECAARAEAILEGEASLASAMEAEIPILDLDRIIDEAAQQETVVSLKTRMRRWARSGTGLTLIPVAAAAAMAALFLVRSPSLPGPEYLPESTPPGLSVEVPEGRNVAIMNTDNPDITVLWLF